MHIESVLKLTRGRPEKREIYARPNFPCKDWTRRCTVPAPHEQPDNHTQHYPPSLSISARATCSCIKPNIMRSSTYSTNAAAWG